MQITKDDKLPDKICDECASKLVLFFKFKQKCEISERTLRRLILKEKIPAVPVSPPIVSKNTTMENLLKKYTNSDKLSPKTHSQKLPQQKILVKEELSEPVPIEKKKDEGNDELKASLKSLDNDEPEMEAEYLLEEFESPIQSEILIKEELIDYDDDDNQMEEDDEEIVSPILQKNSQQIRTKLKPSTKSCSKYFKFIFFFLKILKIVLFQFVNYVAKHMLIHHPFNSITSNTLELKISVVISVKQDLRENLI